ncbi:MAG: hypothetical protein NTV34_19115, partial [Proteobacteria bacterium]|nr:hypothetical protein [Pseudomonadota bacterium]
VHIKSKLCERKADGSVFFSFGFKNGISAKLSGYGMSDSPQDFCDLFNLHVAFDEAFPTSATLRVCFGIENGVGEIRTITVASDLKLLETKSQEAFNSLEECMASSSLTGV